jgi:hypothetical protein
MILTAPKTPAKIGVLALGLVLALSACSDETEEAVQAGSASGEILEGSISDAELPLEVVRSQPPLVEEADESEGEGDDDDEAGDAPAQDDAASEAAAEEPAPAEAE